MIRISLPELIVVLVIVILLFGVGRISKISGELGRAIRSFREGVRGEDNPRPRDPDSKSKTD